MSRDVQYLPPTEHARGGAVLEIYDVSDPRLPLPLATTSRSSLEDPASRGGAPPANTLGCSAYGLDVHPSFGQAGGPAAVTFFEHGLRVLGVDASGQLTEAGGFIPAGGNSSTPVWITDEILYVIDLHRGIDVLRFGGS
ncbi:MAG: hypothetical protein R3343_00030 [Nitriliruptorales bacterium]|nr:hypothetical protein [Nitriliruptorales bacterium]